MDDFDGFFRDPVSLHKYLFTGNDPVNNADPSGNYSISIAYALHYSLSLVNLAFGIHDLGMSILSTNLIDSFRYLGSGTISTTFGLLGLLTPPGSGGFQIPMLAVTTTGQLAVVGGVVVPYTVILGANLAGAGSLLIRALMGVMMAEGGGGGGEGGGGGGGGGGAVLRRPCSCLRSPMLLPTR